MSMPQVNGNEESSNPKPNVAPNISSESSSTDARPIATDTLPAELSMAPDLTVTYANIAESTIEACSEPISDDPNPNKTFQPPSKQVDKNQIEANKSLSESMVIDLAQNETDDVSLKSANLKRKLKDNRPRYKAVSSDSESSSSSDLSSSSEDESADSDNDSVVSCSSDKPKEIPRLKTDGELLLEDLPPIENLEISVPEEKCSVIGHIFNTVETLVLVKAIEGLPPVDIDSVLFLDKGECALGQVFDVIGPVKEPIYCVRFNSKEHINEMYFNVGDPVYYTPTLEFTQYVFLPDLLKAKGSDASWMNGNEPPPDKIDYSDDEQEREAKRKAKNQKRKRDGQNGGDQNSEEHPQNRFSESSVERNPPDKPEVSKRKSNSSSSQSGEANQFGSSSAPDNNNHRNRFSSNPSHQANNFGSASEHENRWKHVNVFQRRNSSNHPNSPSSSSSNNRQSCHSPVGGMLPSQNEMSSHPSQSTNFSPSNGVGNGSQSSPFCVKPPIFQPPQMTAQQFGSPFSGPNNGGGGGFPQCQPATSHFHAQNNQCNVSVASPAMFSSCSSCSCNRGHPHNQVPNNPGPPQFLHTQHGHILPNMNPQPFQMPPPMFHPSSSLGLSDPSLSYGRPPVYTSAACQSTPSYGGPPIFHASVTTNEHPSFSRPDPGQFPCSPQPNMKSNLFQTPTSNGAPCMHPSPTSNSGPCMHPSPTSNSGPCMHPSPPSNSGPCMHPSPTSNGGPCMLPPQTSNGGPYMFQSPPPMMGNPGMPQSMFQPSAQNMRPPMN